MQVHVHLQSFEVMLAIRTINCSTSIACLLLLDSVLIVSVLQRILITQQCNNKNKHFCYFVPTIPYIHVHVYAYICTVHICTRTHTCTYTLYMYMYKGRLLFTHFQVNHVKSNNYVDVGPDCFITLK